MLKPLASWQPLTSQKEARDVTSQFHKVTSALEALPPGKSEPRAALEAELAQLGGRARYQEASMLLTSLNKSSSHWVFQNVTKLSMRPARGADPLRVLEVGAINAQLLSCPWLAVDAIDLKSRHPKIAERDFFDLPCPPPTLYDVVCNAMVLNCVPTPRQRGLMLRRCAAMLRPGGLLALVLPLRFAQQMGGGAVEAVLAALGLTLAATAESPKIAFFAAVRASTSPDGSSSSKSKSVLARARATIELRED